MMYAVYRAWGNEVCSGTNLLFVTANKQIAEDAVALAQLEQEIVHAIPYPNRDPTQHDVYSEKVSEYKKKIAAILTIDPLGLEDHDVSYHFEEIEVR